MLTELPQCPGLALAARYRPAADHAHVGGDWYDAFARDDGSLMLVVGDVVGHDRHAAASMGQLRNLVRGVCVDRHEPARVLAGLDRAVDTMDIHAMASALVARMEPPDPAGSSRPRRLWWSSAGHLPPLLVRSDGTAALLSGEGDLLLGVASDSERAQFSTVVRPGDTVLLYTDGLVESRGRSLDERLGELVDTTSRASGSPPGVQGLVDTMLAEMVPHRPGDDIAVIAVRLEVGAER
jgi:phosphoserine phosphatase RsbU/P